MKPLAVLIFCFVSFIYADTAFSQPDAVADSLYMELERAHEIEKKIDIYLALSYHLRDTDLSNAIEMARRALLLAEKTNAVSSLGLIYAALGEIALMQDSVRVAEQQFKKAREYLSGAENVKALISVYLSIGNRYIDKDNYAEAMRFYLEGIDLSKQSGEDHKLPNLLNNLGIVYLNSNKTRQALDLYSEALELFAKQHDTINVAGITANIGSLYVQMGQYDIAEMYYINGYKLFEKSGNSEGMAHAQLKLGLLKMMQHELDSAAKHLEYSLSLQEKLQVTMSGSKSFFNAETLINLGIVYLNLGDTKRAGELLGKGYDIVKNSQQFRLIALSAQYLSRYYKEINRPWLALDYANVHNQYTDSSYNEESIRKLTQLEMRYQFDIKRSEDEARQAITARIQERKNLIYFIISSSLLFLLVIAILLLRLEKTKKHKIEIERKNLADELEHANKELTTYVMYLLRKNEFITSIAEKLKLARPVIKNENKQVIGDLIRELESNSGMISWDEFEVRFQKVYTGFYKKLSSLYPDLSSNELRLCAFFKLNMTTKEISAITYQSINSITVARYRLRKKLGMNTNEHLVTFLSTL